jgi:predicted ATPase
LQCAKGLAGYRTVESELNQPYFLGLLADANGKVGRAEDGLALVAEAIAIVDRNQESAWEAELYRLKGELTLQSRGHGQAAKFDTAEGCFRRAMAVAGRRRAKSWQLRAAISLARLQRRRGERGDAIQRITEIHGWLTEGFDTKDLREAKALLEELC